MKKLAYADLWFKTVSNKIYCTLKEKRNKLA